MKYALIGVIVAAAGVGVWVLIGLRGGQSDDGGSITEAEVVEAPTAFEEAPPEDPRVEAAPAERVAPVVEDVGRSIGGRVVDGMGAPVAGAVVMAYDANRGATRTISGEDGWFNLAGLDLDAYRVSAGAEGFNDAVVERVPRGRQDLRLELTARSTVEGVVVDHGSQAPLAVFEVAYLQTAPGDAEHWVRDVANHRVPWVAVTDDSGEFELENIISDAPFAVAARAAGYAPTYVRVGAIAPATTKRDVRIALRAQGA